MPHFKVSASEPIIKRSLIDGEEEEKIISVEFTVPEYNRDGTFKLAKYSYQANNSDNPEIDKGWTIFRNDEKMLSVEDGYVIVTGKYCGICSTDLARRFLPFPLPQIIGHEAVAIHKSKPVVIEINASHHARGIHENLNPPCSFCQHGLSTQCPDRITLGIDRLPGGFAPYILAPKNAIIPVPDNLSLKAASFAEPFAAALNAVETTPPINGQEVAVLGPRKLGMFIIAALNGHEAVAIHKSKPVVIEINASHHARGIHENLNPPCSFCQHGLSTQCPDRITLGIDRLPGGFAPYILAPKNAIIPVPDNLSLKAASFAEPFAAALNAVETTPPINGQEVAVLGPRKLGMFIIAALNVYKKSHNLDFQITAIFHKNPPPTQLVNLARELGSQIESSSSSITKKFDIVFDTTGSPQGFLQSIKITKKILHLKSTHGQNVCGLNRMTDFVVEELSLLKFSEKNLEFSWPNDFSDDNDNNNNRRMNHNVLVTPSVNEKIINSIKSTGRNVILKDANNSINDILEWIDQSNKGQVLDQNLKNSPVPRFDLVVIGNLKEIDSVIRPKEGMDLSILRSRGAILYSPSEPPPYDYDNDNNNDNDNEIQLLSKALIEDDIQIWSTRCGNLKNSLKGLSKNLEITNILEKNMITKEITLENLDEGFDLAMRGDHIKILVDVEAKNTI
ncbi:hypothetical protein Glove_357g34 [Diversispora epigaea]|uniref:Alcohol dehydrogenase-like N-terminal domain-containing protein n=1 Tax=Diversispora epigaea TaxID=1348612 RepID=A0A397HDQ2_9GLOM|nr:hypothetical protein Glove_357g34 [Diversispora epigaea]